MTQQKHDRIVQNLEYIIHEHAHKTNTPLSTCKEHNFRTKSGKYGEVDFAAFYDKYVDLYEVKTTNLPSANSKARYQLHKATEWANDNGYKVRHRFMVYNRERGQALTDTYQIYDIDKKEYR